MKKNRCEYVEAVNGLEALDTYKSDPTRWSAILMDISMPVMDGLTSTREIRKYEATQHLPRSLIICITGLASGAAQHEAMESGVDHFMTKPANFRQLTRWMKMHVDVEASNTSGD